MREVRQKCSKRALVQRLPHVRTQLVQNRRGLLGQLLVLSDCELLLLRAELTALLIDRAVTSGRRGITASRNSTAIPHRPQAARNAHWFRK